MNEDPTGLVAKIQAMADGRKDDDAVKEAGPNEVGPTTGTQKSPLVTLPFTESDITQWWEEVEKARSRVKSREEAWDTLLNEYMPVVSKSGQAETVKVQAHFRNVHTKLGNLWYRSPDVVCIPDDPGPGLNQLPQMPPVPGQAPQPPETMESIIAIKQAVIRKKMGRDGIKANRLMDELLFDVLAWSGIGCAKVGYKCTFKTIQKPKLVPAPQQPGAMLGLQQGMVPDPSGAMESQKVPIHESYYARRFSPKKALWNSTLKSTRFDEDASWMGMDFYISKKTAMASPEEGGFGLTEDEATKSSKDDRVHEYPDDKQGSQSTGLIHGIEIWCRANLFTDEVHPEAICQLVLIEGIKNRPIVWRPSPDQEFDPNTGKLTPDSLLGFPIKILTIRDLADSCFPPSDSAFTNSEIKQLSTYRRQTIRLRDASIGKYLYDTDAFDEPEIEQLKNGDIGDFIPVQSGKMKEGVDKIFAATTKLLGSADDQRGFLGIKQDMGETLGIGSNQAGTETDTVRTATESDRVAQAVQSRNDKELSRVVDFYLDIVRSIDQLLMRYMTDAAYVEIAGDGAAAEMKRWNGKLISGRYLYDIAPDSQLRPDSANDERLTMQFYNLTAKDPMVNRGYLLRRMARMRGWDPAKIVMPPPPPPVPPPPPPNPLALTLSLTVDDLLKPEVQALVQQFADNMKPKLAMTGSAPPAPQQPPHGGPADHADVISEHMISNSGGKQNAPGATNHRAEQVK